MPRDRTRSAIKKAGRTEEQKAESLRKSAQKASQRYRLKYAALASNFNCFLSYYILFIVIDSKLTPWQGSAWPGML